MKQLIPKIPEYLITIIIAIIVSWMTMNIKLSIIENMVKTHEVSIEKLENQKLDKDIYIELTKRFDRLENKLDAIIEKK